MATMTRGTTSGARPRSTPMLDQLLGPLQGANDAPALQEVPAADTTQAMLALAPRILATVQATEPQATDVQLLPDQPDQDIKSLWLITYRGEPRTGYGRVNVKHERFQWRRGKGEGTPGYSQPLLP